MYLDTLEDEFAGRSVALRFRLSAAVASIAAPRRAWRKQWIWPEDEGGLRTIEALGIRRLKQRFDATFSIRIERWSWQPKSWAKVSLDIIAISTGGVGEDKVEMRIRCRKTRRCDDAGDRARCRKPRVVASPRARACFAAV